MRVPLPDDEYKNFVAALGHLCMFWAGLDRELNHLIGALLRITDEQAACIASEMNDVAPRCRLIKTLSYTVDVPQAWRDTLVELSNLICNDFAPRRNRFVHDLLVEGGTVMTKTNRRTKIAKLESFGATQLLYDTVEDVTCHDIQELTIKTLMASARVATARFDLESLWKEGRFPESPQLSPADVQWTAQFQLQSDAEEPPLPPQPSEA